jgi:hypothetical protein
MSKYNTYEPTLQEREFVGNLIHCEPNDISFIYFSDNNINKINKILIEDIKNITFERYNKKLLIDPQQKTILVTIMRHVFFKNIKNTFDTNVEVDLLNKEVIKNITPIIMNGLLSQLRYINDYNSIRPIDRPESVKKNNINNNTKPMSSLFE